MVNNYVQTFEETTKDQERKEIKERGKRRDNGGGKGKKEKIGGWEKREN